MKRFQWNWIFTGSKTCCTIWRPFWVAMAAILNPKWPPKYKNLPILAKFGFLVDFVLANWYPSSFLELGAMLWSFRSYHILLLLLLLLLFHFQRNFVSHFSRRCLDQTLWNLIGISYATWSCAFKCWFFQNGCRCHGNCQNAKKLKKHKNDHSRLLAKQKLMKLNRNNIYI